MSKIQSTGTTQVQPTVKCSPIGQQVVGSEQLVVDGTSPPPPSSHIHSAALVRTEGKIDDLEKITTYRARLPRYIHDFRNTLSRLLANVDSFMLHNAEFVPVGTKFTGDCYALIGVSPNIFDTWISKSQEDDMPSELVETMRGLGKDITNKFEELVKPLIQEVHNHQGEDKHNDGWHKIELAASSVIDSLRTFTSTAFEADFVGVPKIIDPHRICCEIAASMRDAAPGLQLDIKDPVMIGEECFVRIDPVYFVHCLENIIGNAAKAARKAATDDASGVEFNINIINKGNIVEVVLEDKGPGMPPDIIEKVLQREETSTTLGEAKGGDTNSSGVNQGFGMQNVIRYIEAADGAVKISSSREIDNHFTRFSFELPVSAKPAALVYSSKETGPELESDSETKEIKDPLEERVGHKNLIMIVHPYGAENLAGVLNSGKKEDDKDFYYIACAKTPEEGLIKYEKYKPSAIVVVEEMKGMSGRQMLDEIKSIHGRIPPSVIISLDRSITYDGVDIVPPGDIITLEEKLAIAVKK
jgi:signal transduction histidine kinase/CheY-like chemotaxis protein